MTEWGIVTTAGAGVAMNTIHTVSVGQDPFPTLFAGSLWIGACVLIGEGNAMIGGAFAAVYLLAVVILRGQEFFNTLTDLTKGSK